jgi:precorrin-2 dehydrogenase/sirohydrochlorin ferrochelatase
MALYPIFLKLEGRKVLIVGGGAIAEEKLEGVLRSATDVTVVSPRVSPRIKRWAEQGLLKLVMQEYHRGMAKDYFLVIAATEVGLVNRAVYEDAQRAGALGNAVDDPAYCDFYSPSVVSRGPFQIAISTGGHSPALAQQVRKKLEQQYGPEFGPWTEWLGRMRSTLRSVLPPGERRKQLLHLIALCKPKSALRQDLNFGGE